MKNQQSSQQHSQPHNQEQQKQPAFKEVWEMMNQYIHTIQTTDMDYDTSMLASMLASLPDSGTPKKRSRFDAYIQAGNTLARSNNAPSLLLQWGSPAHQHTWLANLYTAWQSAALSMKLTEHQLKQAILPIQQVMQELSFQLTPAPAIRDAQLLQEKVYAPKRRGIEAAALPVFNPLFCTAISPSSQTVKLQGLQPLSQYRLTMRGIAQSDWLHETTLMTTETGVCELDIESVLQKYKVCNPGHTRIAWYLRKLNSQHKSDWTCGVIWLDEPVSENGEEQTIHKDSSWRGTLHKEYVTLIDINLLIARGFYVQAYEQARHALIFARKNRLAPDSLYMASLWQFCRQAVSEMIQTMRGAAPVFMQIDPSWNALNPLEDLLTLMTPRV